jgi:hypothetical protein
MYKPRCDSGEPLVIHPVGIMVPRRVLDYCFENGVGCVGMWFETLDVFYTCERQVSADSGGIAWC